MMKEEREGSVRIDFRQNVYTIRTWAFLVPNIIWGVYHAGVQINGLGEYSFDSTGIYRLSYDEVRDIPVLKYAGCKVQTVTSNLNTIEAIIENMRKEYPPGSYHYLEKNCHHFCDDFARKLNLVPLDRKYTRAPRLLLDWKKPIKESMAKKADCAIGLSCIVAGTVAAAHKELCPLRYLIQSFSMYSLRFISRDTTVNYSFHLRRQFSIDSSIQVLKNSAATSAFSLSRSIFLS